MSELLKRVLVGLIGIPFALIVIYLGSYYFFGIILIISVISLLEFYKLVQAKGFSPLIIEGTLILIILESTVFSFFIVTDIFDRLGIFVIIIKLLLLIFLLIFGINLFTRKENAIVNISTTIGGLVFVLIPFLSLLAIRLSQNDMSDATSSYFVIAYFISIWVCDSAAYFIGKPFGKHKISPRISPKKSWEGGIAGLLTSILAFFLFGYFLKFPFNVIQLISFGLVIGIAGQLGDFLESSFKRDANVKDSSKLLSEHGGMLDRMDSIMFTAPAILLLLTWFLQ